MANLVHEVQVGMNPDLIGTDQAKEIDPNVFCKSLQFRRSNIVVSKRYVDEHRRVVASVKTDTIIDSLHEGIARVLHLQSMDPVRDFLASDQLYWNDCHRFCSCSSIPRS
jgi:hypothetical protein